MSHVTPAPLATSDTESGPLTAASTLRKHAPILITENQIAFSTSFGDCVGARTDAGDGDDLRRTLMIARLCLALEVHRRLMLPKSSALIVLDLSGGEFRRWWSARAFTTDAIAGILVVLLTALIVNQALGIRRDRERFRTTAAQASMVLGQAIRITRAVLACTTSGDRTAASDELRTYMIMLMIAAPMLIESKIPRAILADAQTLGGMLVQVQHSESQSSFKAVASDASLKKRCASSKSPPPRCLHL